MNNCYEKLLNFLNANVERTDIDYILSRIEQLGVTPPQSIVLFYHYLGNCDLALRGYYNLFKINELKIWHNGLIFGINDENGILGIKIEDLSRTEDPSIYYGHENSNDWYSELNRRGGAAFFFNIACTNITYSKKYIATVYMKKSEFYENILNKVFLSSFTDNVDMIHGYQRCGCYSKSGNIMASYFSLTETLLVGADRKEFLEEFFNKTGWKYKIVNKNPSKRVKKTKLKQADEIAMEQCYLSLEKYLPDLPERIDETVIKTKEEELGIVFPNSLVRFYNHFGNCDEVLNSDITFEKLQDIHIVNETVVVGYSNQRSATYGFKIEELGDKEPCISEFTDEKCTEEVKMYSGTAFYFNAACYNIVLSMPSVVQIKKSHRYFFSNILDKRNVYSFDDNKDIKKGFFICGCHDENCQILGCYVSDELDTLFLGAYTDEILKEFENKSKWEFDYL